MPHRTPQAALTGDNDTMRLIAIESKLEIAPVRELFLEYAGSLGTTCAFKTSSRNSRLPRLRASAWSAPSAMEDARPAGCVALRKLSAGVAR